LLDGPPFNLNLSPLSYLYRALSSGGGGPLRLLLICIPLLYCAVCAYFAMFRMRLCDFYALHPHGHSDASSLLFNATYACRLGPPLCFNFLRLIHDDDVFAPPPVTGVHTFFSETSFGEMDKIDIQLFSSDGYFNNGAPLLIVFLCGFTYLNLGSEILSCCGRCCSCFAAPSFSFDEDFSDGRIDHGAAILAREQQAIADGVPIGSNLQMLSGATSDSEEAAKKSSSRPKKWNRLADENL